MLNIEYVDIVEKLKFSQLKDNETFVLDGELYVKLSPSCKCRDYIYAPNPTTEDEIDFNCINLSKMKLCEISCNAYVEEVDCDVKVKKVITC